MESRRLTAKKVRSVLVLDDDDGYGALCADELAPRRVVPATTVPQAMTLLENDVFDLVFVDLFLHTPEAPRPSRAFAWGIDVVSEVRRAFPDQLLILVSGGNSLPFAIAAKEAGADATVPKQYFSPRKIVSLVEAGRLGELEDSCLPRARKTLRENEWEHIARTYLETGRNIAATAAALKVSRTTLYRKIDERRSEPPATSSDEGENGAPQVHSKRGQR